MHPSVAYRFAGIVLADPRALLPTSESAVVGLQGGITRTTDKGMRAGIDVEVRGDGVGGTGGSASSASAAAAAALDAMVFADSAVQKAAEAGMEARAAARRAARAAAAKQRPTGSDN
jgi:hypothetical protein